MGNEYKDRTVRNNGRKIGRTRSYENNIRKLKNYRVKRVIATAAIISFTAGLGAGVGGTKLVESFTKDETQIETVNGTKDKVYEDEPRYRGIYYDVQMGDTLSGIVYSYETDADKVNEYIDKICEINKLGNKNSLSDRDVIELYGVPSSKLEQFGYTDNYNYFDPSVEMNDRLEFIKTQAEKKDDATLLAYYENLKDKYQDYKDNHINDDDVEILNDLFEELRDVCRFIDEQYDVSFDYNKKAMSLSEATKVEKVSYAY